MSDNFMPPLFATPPAEEEDDFNAIGGEIFATFSPWASWLSDGNPFAPVTGSLPFAAAGDPTGAQPGSAVAVTAGGITINVIYAAAALAAPATFRAGIEQAVGIMAAAISDKITVNIKIDYSGTGGGAAAGPDHGLLQSYSSVRTNLISHASAGDTTFDALTAGSTIQGQSSVAVWNAQLKLWGALGANDTTTDDGAATFATDIDPGLLVGVALHELTHAMGRIPYGPQPDIFDLFRFTSAGTRLFQGGASAPAAYFSLDGGNTKVADYGRTSDASDFLNSGVQGPNDPFNEFYNGRTAQQLTAADLKQLDALGFHLMSAAGAVAGSISINDVALSEGDSGTTVATFTVTRSGGTAAFSVNYVTSDGTATAADGDYVAASGTLAFGAGVNSQTFSVLVNGDTRVESNETFYVNLSAASNGATIVDNQGFVTVANDDRAPGSISINDVALSEGDSGTTIATFTVTRSGGTAAFNVNYLSADGTATTADGDYVAASGTLAFGAGVNSQTFSVLVNGDTRVESNETFYVNLSAATNGATIADNQGYVFIANDDSAPGSISITDVALTEGNSGTTTATVTVVRSGGTSAFNINYVTADGTATTADGDYVAASGTLAFGAGVNTGTFSVLVNGDTKVESNETFYVNLLGATNGAMIADNQGWVFIGNDDRVNHAPTVAVPQVNVPAHTAQPLQAASLFIGADPDGDPLTYYLFDNSPDPASGHFAIDGVTVPAQETATVSAAQLAHVTFVPGAPGSPDNLYVMTSDGALRSDLAWLHVDPLDQAPAVTVPQVNVTAHTGQPLQAASLFSAGDPDGDALTYYLFDNSPDPTSGHFVVDGTLVVAQETVALTAAQLAHTTFVPGSAGSSDNLYVMVSDGALRSGLSWLHVDSVDHAPVLTVPQVNLSGHSGQPLQAASLFGASDADGDALTWYLFDNSPGPSTGHFAVNGVAVAPQETVAVTAAQLAQTTLIPGAPGTADSLYVVASDGQLRSDLGYFHVDWLV